MRFTDEGYIINMRRHGENSLILTLISRTHGKVTGFVRSALSRKKLSTFQLGNLVEFEAYARVDDNMLALRVDLKNPVAVHFLSDAEKLCMLTSFCALANACLPELENLETFYRSVDDIFNFIHEDNWIVYYAYYEFYLLDFLGVGLDLSECSATGVTENLAYVSPKTGKAVCAEAGEPYKNRLYKYPDFILKNNYHPQVDELVDLLKMTAFFLNKNFFNPHNLKFPQSRANLAEIISNLTF